MHSKVSLQKRFGISLKCPTYWHAYIINFDRTVFMVPFLSSIMLLSLQRYDNEDGIPVHICCHASSVKLLQHYATPSTWSNSYGSLVNKAWSLLYLDGFILHLFYGSQTKLGLNSLVKRASILLLPPQHQIEDHTLISGYIRIKAVFWY